MALYQAAHIYIGSGLQGSETMVSLGRATSLNINSQVSRADVSVLGRGKPLAQRPVINYTPVDVSFEAIHSDSSLVTCLGLVNPTGVTAGLVETRAGYPTYAVRNMQARFATAHSTAFHGGRDLKSGVLTNFSLQGGISEPVRCSVGMQFLDMSGYSISTARPSTDLNTNLVKPKNITLTGIQFSGFGATGVNIQSFSLGINFNRASVMQLGQCYPVERPLTDVAATFSVQGYVEGLTNGLSDLQQYSRGDPMNGEIALSLYPSDGGSPTTITLVRPYFDTETLTPQVGNFTTVSYSFSLPLGPNPNETTDGSVVRIT